MFLDWLAAVLIALIVSLLLALVISFWIRNLDAARGSRHQAPQPPPASNLEIASRSQVVEELRPEPAHERYRRWSSLTSRERTVAELASEGKSTEEIARELSISTRTVSKHLEHIFRKLEIKSRAEIKYIRLHVVALEQDRRQKRDT